MSGGMQSGGVSKELLTTKGDTHGYSTLNERVPIGANTQVLTADSTEALGLKWAAAAAGGATLGAEESTVSGLDVAQITVGTNQVYSYGFVIPSTEIWYKVTGFEWENGATVAGNCINRLYTHNPNDGQFSLLAWGTAIACSGANSTQRNSEVSSNIIKGGTSVVMQISFSDNTHTVRSPNFTQVVGTETYTVDPPNAMSHSWANSGTNPLQKCYYQGFS
tara:strand:- start:464 stop:1123 length:660 start_codon:yes stop_codon:yes gene_type:complete